MISILINTLTAMTTSPLGIYEVVRDAGHEAQHGTDEGVSWCDCSGDSVVDVSYHRSSRP